MALNHSRQREAIMNFLMQRKDHPTAEVIYDNVRMIYPKISLGTVYRNLSLLTDTGEIRRLRTKDSKDHYDADLSPHYHFICDKCNSISDIYPDKPEIYIDAAREKTKARITGHEVFYYGICSSCIDMETQAESENLLADLKS